MLSARRSRYNSWADFLLGLPNTAGKVDQLRNPNAVYMQTYALYARDHFQLTRNLTVTYGLRWEFFKFPDKDNTGINRFDPNDGNVYTGGLSGVPRDTGASSGPGLFLPRVGFAYRFGENAKTVLRAGYGMSADPRPFIDFRNAYPIVNAWAMPQIVFGGAANAFIPVTTFRQGLINTSPAPDLTQGIIKLPANSGTTTYPAEQTRKYIQSWNITLEHELPWRLVGEVGYVGTRAVGQMGFININASAPGTGNAGRALSRFGLTADINEILPYQTTTYDAHTAFASIIPASPATSQVSAATIKAMFDYIMIKHSRGTKGPNLILSSAEHYTAYTAATVAIQRINDESTLGKMGFTALKYYGAGKSVDVVLEGGIGSAMPANTTYFIDTAALKFRYHPDRNFVKFGGKQMPINQDAVVQHIGFFGELTMNNPLHMVKLYDSTPGS